MVIDWNSVQALRRIMDELVDAYGNEDLPDLVLDTLARLNTEWHAQTRIGAVQMP